MTDYLHSDKPISDVSDDLFRRGPFVDLLYQEIKSIPDTESVTIGLSGSWGSGKTSIINLVCQKLEKDRTNGNLKPGDTIVVRFNPWNQINADKDSEEYFIRSFFDALRNQLWKDKDGWYISPSNLRVFSESIDEYISLIKPGFLKATISTTRKIFRKRRDCQVSTIASAKKMIKKSLGDFDIKILVVIDDIDRLSVNRIRLVFQLITAIADFESVNYLIAYDRSVVEKAVGDIQGIGGKDYLEKVIQVPVDVPKLPAPLLSAVISKYFRRIPNYYYLEGEREDAAYRFSMALPLLQQGLCSIRQVNRLENALRLKLPITSDYLDAIDLLMMEYLRVAFPDVLQWIVEHKAELCVDENLNAFVKSIMGENIEQIKKSFIAELNETYPDDVDLFEVIDLLFMKPRLMFEANQQRSYATYKQKRIIYPQLFEFFLTTDGSGVECASDSVLDYLKRKDAREVSLFIHNAGRNGSYLEAVEAMSAVESELDESETKIAIKAFAENISFAEHAGLAFSENTRTIDIIDSFLQKVDASNRDGFVLSLFRELDSLSVISLAEFIIRHERVYERNHFTGGSYEKLVSEETIITLESIFSKAMMELAQNDELIFIPDIYPQMLLWKIVTNDTYRNALEMVSQDSRRIALFALSFVSPWRAMGTGIISSFTVNNEIFDYADRDTLIRAAQKTVLSHDFREMPISTQQKIVALSLSLKGEKLIGSIGGDVDIEVVDKWFDDHCDGIRTLAQ